jgi:hAT family C-terminal dimerisation region
MALDALSILVIFVEYERYFSSSGNIVIDNRNRLNPTNINDISYYTT